jgi:energy-coupling factor transport system ATP-binding protein
LKFQGETETDIQQRVTEGLSEVGLLGVRDRHPYSLPKGDRARVVIAAILALKPEVIIFDEPTVGQDYAGARKILGLTKHLHEMGKTVIVITHHLYLMPEYAQRMVVLDRGKVTMDAPLRSAYHRVNDLRGNHLEPPPSVFLAQEIAKTTGKEAWQVTPEEIFDSFLQTGIGEER